MARLSVTEYPSFVSIDAGGTRIARYNHVGAWKPYVWPLMGPCGNVLRGAGGDHPHQCGLFLAYGGHDDGPTNIFSDWDEPPYGPCGKMLHQGFDLLAGGDGRARIVQRLLYVDGEGAPILTETRDLRFFALAGGECLIDWRTTAPPPSEPGERAVRDLGAGVRRPARPRRLTPRHRREVAAHRRRRRDGERHRPDQPRRAVRRRALDRLLRHLFGGAAGAGAVRPP